MQDLLLSSFWKQNSLLFIIFPTAWCPACQKVGLQQIFIGQVEVQQILISSHVFEREMTRVPTLGLPCYMLLIIRNPGLASREETQLIHTLLPSKELTKFPYLINQKGCLSPVTSVFKKLVKKSLFIFSQAHIFILTFLVLNLNILME